MNNNQLTEKQERQKKFFLVLPAFAAPFITLMFWLMGGGSGTQSIAAESNSGFNSLIPEAHKDEVDSKDKLASYEQARQDSIKKLEAARQDPYYMTFQSGTEGEFGGLQTDPAIGYPGAFGNHGEQKIYSKLSELNKSLEHQHNQEQQYNGGYGSGAYRSTSYRSDPQIASLKQDISHLEEMMRSMQSAPMESDPEMEQINSVLQSVLDIQHPERVQERLQKESEQKTGQVFAVARNKSVMPLTLLDNRSAVQYAKDYEADPSGNTNRFFGLDNSDNGIRDQNGIAAVIHEDQTVVAGATVKLRLINDVLINGIAIPRHHFIYGTASLRGERLEIDIASIRHENSLFPISLSVHDMDGLAGVHIPGAITRDVIKQNSEQSMQSLNLGTFNPSLGAQAASAGIELGKNLFSRKVKLVKVDLKAGYKVLLRDNKRKDK